jgi:hypothetical protein
MGAEMHEKVHILCFFTLRLHIFLESDKVLWADIFKAASQDIRKSNFTGQKFTHFELAV